MDYDERLICDFLKAYAGQHVSARVIARRVGGRRRYLEDPQWARPVLAGLVEKGLLETDAQDHYRLKKVVPCARGNRTFVSPQVRRLLERSSKDFSRILHDDGDGPESV